ncbi:MAG: glycosyltransferase family 39 protein [Oligoflexia bacterium]|nr:glycosyltransferase family 39 protein [Oligoflexia bacterium]
MSLILRISQLSNQSYWIDEMVSLYFTTRDAWFDIFRDNHPFLYHFILKIWIKIFGVGEFATRFLSVIFSTCTTAVVYILSRRLFINRFYPILAAVLHSISSMSIIYAQETRMYALFELASIVNLYFFYQTFIAKKDGYRNYIFSSILLALTHYGAALIFIYQGFYLYFINKTKNIKPFLGAFFALTVGFFSYLVIFNWPSLDWQKFKYIQEVTAQSPMQAILYLSNFSYINLAIFIFTLLMAYRLSKLRQNQVFNLLLGFITFSITTLLIASHITQRALMLPRYLIFINPAFILLFCYCLLKINKKWLPSIFAALFISTSLYHLPKAYYETKAPWRDLMQKISEHPGSIVLTTRTLAIRTPYLERYKIKVEKFNPFMELDFKDYFSLYKYLWVVENYWGGSNYIESLKERLKKSRYNIEVFEFKTKYSEPLTAIRVGI